MAVIVKMGGCSTHNKKIGMQFLTTGSKSTLGGSYPIVGDTMVEGEQKLAPTVEIGQSFIRTGCRLCGNKFAYRCGACGRIICYNGNAQTGARCPICGAVGNLPKARGVEIPVSSAKGRVTETVEETEQGQIVQITFSNVTWTKFDNVSPHESAGSYSSIEPKVHVIYDEERIEFHGYNVSRMDEGVYYTIGAKDDFSIECDVNTSTIKPHPGGHLYIELGIISAQIKLEGGSFYLDGRNVCNVGSQFHMRLSRTGGNYEIFIDGKRRGEKKVQTTGATKIVFGFKHDSHYCELLSHAYISDIKMTQCAW